MNTLLKSYLSLLIKLLFLSSVIQIVFVANTLVVVFSLCSSPLVCSVGLWILLFFSSFSSLV